VVSCSPAPLAALVAAGLPVWYAKELVAADQPKDGPKDKIIMGAIGLGSPQSRGRAIMGEAMAQAGVEYVAVCDVDKAHREKAIDDVKSAQKKNNKPESEVKAYEDFRELLDRKDIQAVTIATPITGTPWSPSTPCARARTSTARSRSP